MSTRELVVLGTASQVPTRYRNHNGYLLKWDGRGVLFDPGEGTQRQMVRAGVSATSITRICITHFHGDHSLGLAGITQRISLDQVPHEIEVHYPSSGQKYYERLRHASIFRDRARLVPRPITETGVIYQDERIVLTAERLDHGVETYGYRIEERPSVQLNPTKLASLGLHGPVIGQLKREGTLVHHGRTLRVEEVSTPRLGQVFAFVMDSRPCAGAMALAHNADLLVCESTFLQAHTQEAHEYGHMTAHDAASLARDAGAHTLVLTHFSQRYPRLEPFLEEATPLHPNTLVARDGERIAVPPR